MPVGRTVRHVRSLEATPLPRYSIDDDDDARRCGAGAPRAVRPPQVPEDARAQGGGAPHTAADARPRASARLARLAAARPARVRQDSPIALREGSEELLMQRVFLEGLVYKRNVDIADLRAELRDVHRAHTVELDALRAELREARRVRAVGGPLCGERGHGGENGAEEGGAGPTGAAPVLKADSGAPPGYTHGFTMYK